MSLHPSVNQTLSLKIHGLGSHGEGVGSSNGYTVFVEGALPGEEVKALLLECHKNYGRALLQEINKPSPNRVHPPCPLFSKCGGCQLMHLSYQSQLEMKQQRVIDALKHVGKLEGIRVHACLPSPSSLAYRNKIQLPAQNGKEGISLGLYARSSHDLVEVEKCLIHCPLGEDIFRKIQDILKKSHLKAYHPETKAGELRHVLIKSALKTNEALVILVTNNKETSTLLPLAKEIMDAYPPVKGVIHNYHKEPNNVILGKTFNVLAGSGSIVEILCDLKFKISPASFFQVNPYQAECLYLKALQFAHLQGEETILDAYCGVGTLSLIFAAHAKKVIGVECVPEAIRDAQENARLNDISNVSFICAPSEKFIKSLSEIDLILLNPPRKGCAPSFLQETVRLSPKKLIYISCDPATLSRDLAYLYQFGYKAEEIQPFDMFPQTSHVECVVKLIC